MIFGSNYFSIVVYGIIYFVVILFMVLGFVRMVEYHHGYIGYDGCHPVGVFGLNYECGDYVKPVDDEFNFSFNVSEGVYDG